MNLRNRSPWEQIRRGKERGQIVVEYVLLLVIAVTVAVILTRGLIGRSPGSEGIILNAWQNILLTISYDKPDDIKR